MSLSKFSIFVLFTIVIIYFFSVFGTLFISVPWIDIPLHFLGGVWIASIFAWLFPEVRFNNPKFFINKLPPFVINFLLVIAFTVLVGVLWEFFEFSLDVLMVFRGYSEIFQGDLVDTMGDLLMDILGGLTLGVVYQLGIFRKD